MKRETATKASNAWNLGNFLPKRTNNLNMAVNLCKGLKKSSMYEMGFDFEVNSR